MNSGSADPAAPEVLGDAPSSPRPSGGQLLTALSTAIVKLVREHYGRGPIRAKTYVHDDIIVVVMRGSGFTPLEQTMMDSGEADRSERVVAMREEFQRLMAERYTHAVEELTDRKVLAFLSQAHVEPDITLEVFFVDGPLAGFGPGESAPGARPPGRTGSAERLGQRPNA